ncbi:VOC family protein [Gordonia soli]|uniref:VOC domain-containing protein n=1 Tax=Gordonia soli NBRC 108243 TaxID=1223545 RepID=M0QJ58_9ACTN|nr:VOC family protein [Gordonia soli]GAC68598.1 hypothetical protein GS4_16_01290 [Gordonia soli NBRC 108243]
MTTTTPRLITGHVGLNVTDIDRSTAFYRQVFGWDVQGEGTDPDRRWAFLGDDGALLVTLWQQSSGRFDPAGPGLHHLSFQVGDVEAVRAIESRVRELGGTVHFDGVVVHGEGASSGAIFFDDPDGTRLEVFTPTGVDETAPAPSGEAPTCGFF